jgi:hypothetical protein
MKVAVEKALEELRRGLPGTEIVPQEDPDGGAHVLVKDLDVGSSFAPTQSWVSFHITFAYPDADVYPHFIDAGVRYVGEGDAPNQFPAGNLPKAMTRDAVAPGFDLPAIQVSRRSETRDPTAYSALTKLLSVLEFLRTR